MHRKKRWKKGAAAAAGLGDCNTIHVYPCPAFGWARDVQDVRQVHLLKYNVCVMRSAGATSFGSSCNLPPTAFPNALSVRGNCRFDDPCSLKSIDIKDHHGPLLLVHVAMMLQALDFLGRQHSWASLLVPSWSEVPISNLSQQRGQDHGKPSET